ETNARGNPGGRQHAVGTRVALRKRTLVDHLQPSEKTVRQALDEARRLSEHHAGRAVVDVDRVAQIEVFLGARDGDVEEPPLLLNLLRVVEVVVGGEAPVT